MSDTPLKIVSWNIQAIRGAGTRKVAAVRDALEKHAPDVVVLQEVSALGDVAERLRTALASIGLSHFCFSGNPNAGAGEKKYGNVIASRWPLEPQTWKPKPTWPQLVVAAMVQYPPGRVFVVGVHIPNGSDHGWEKVFALEAVAKGLAPAETQTPCILAGDFNEPLAFAPEFLSARAVFDGHLDGDFRDPHGVEHPRRRWQDAVEAVLWPPSSGAREAWDGTHTIARVGAEFEPTHITKGEKQRSFDHILTSGYLFSVRSAGYDHSVRLGERPVSDHSIVYAALGTGGEQFDDA